MAAQHLAPADAAFGGAAELGAVGRLMKRIQTAKEYHYGN